MAEEKIIKHAGDAARALLKKEHSWKKKLREFFFEIFIIVVAVSITLWFHNWNDHLHEQRLARDFLVGIRADLKVTADKLAEHRHDYQHTLDYYDAIWKQISENRIDKAYMDSLSGNLTNMVGFTFDNSRFESFKSSGNLRLIENQPLMQNITRMFTVTLPDRVASDRMIFEERRNQYITYIGTRTPFGPRGNSLISGYTNDPAIRFQIMWQRDLLNEMKDQKLLVAEEVGKLMAEIDAELKR
ncbi:hypothetical protein [Puia sp.]|jgi:hypothetical protein|uniref:hypothetical protein n=1 Tax=Puia sp. TaxID=2045100 RepID=UPI002F4283B8